MSLFSLQPLKAWRQNQFLRSTVQTLLGRFGVMGLGLITNLLLARSLGPEGRGLYAATFTLAALGIQFGNFGLHAANTYYAARDTQALPHLVTQSVLMSLSLGLLICLVIFGINLIFPQWFDLEWSVLSMCLLLIPAGLMYSLISSLVLGLGKMRLFNAAEIAQRLLILLVMLGLMALTWQSPTAYLGSAGLLTGLSAIAIVIYLRRSHQLNWDWQRNLLRQSLVYGLGSYGAALFSFLLLRSDLLLIKSSLGANDTGLYSVAVSMVDLVYLAPMTIGMILFSRLSSSTDNAYKWKTTKKVVPLVLAMLAPFVLVFAIYGQDLINLLFGAEFGPAAQPMFYLLGAIVFLSIGTMMQNYLAAMGLTYRMMMAPMLTAPINIGANLYFLPKYGIVGAGYAALLSHSLFAGISFLVAWTAHRRCAIAQT